MNSLLTVGAFFKFSKRTVFTSLFFTLAIFSWWFSKVDFTLEEVKNGIVGIATLDMADVGARISVFYKSIFFLVILYLVALALIRFIQKQDLLSEVEILILNCLSAVGVMALLFNLLISHNDNTVRFMILNVFLILIFAIIRKTLGKTGEWSLSKYQYIYIAAVSFSIACVFSFLLKIAGSEFKFSFNYGFAALGLLLMIGIAERKISNAQFQNLVYLSRPIFLLPLLNFFSIETYLILNQRQLFLSSPALLFVIGIGILIAYYFFLNHKIRKGMKLPAVRKQIDYFSIPCLVATIGFYIFYKPIMEQSAELFELANSANAMMRFYDFGEIPLLESYSSHVLSDQAFGLAYFFLNGYNQSIDYTLYYNLFNVIHLLIVYFFLLRLTGNAMLALATILFFPFLKWLLHPAYILSLINLFLIYKLFEKYSFKKLLHICLCAFLLLFWTIDMGIANAIAVSTILLFYLIMNYKNSLLMDYLKAIAYLLIPFILIMTGLVILFGIPIGVNLKQAYGYISASQAHGYTLVSPSMDKYFYIQHFLFPVIALGMLIFSWYSFPKKEEKGKQRLGYLTIIFLLVFYFANVQRGLVRHSFMEGSDIFLSSFMFFVIPLFITIHLLKKSSWKYFFMIVLCALTMNAYKIPYKERDNLFHGFQDVFMNGLPMVNSDTLIQRTIPNKEFAEQNYLGFKKFFESNFERDATFMDFSNTPMLYFYLNRRVPSYFNQYMQNTVTGYLQEENLNQLRKLNVPVVVYSYVPEQWWDNTDGVPNPLRYHVTSNYIFNNYRPLTVLSNHFIWVKKDVTLKNNDYPPLDSLLLEKQYTYELKNLPYLLSKNNTKDSSGKLIDWEAGKNLSSNSMTITAGLDKSKGNHLELVIDNPGEQAVASLTYSANGKILGTYTFFVHAQKMDQKYIIPISVQYSWHRNNADAITLSIPSDQIKLKKGTLLKGGIY